MVSALAAWRVIGASVQGSSHRVLGIPCQDAHSYRCLADRTLVLAVTDGAGSAQKAQEGAQFAAAWTTDALCQRLEGQHPSSPEEWETLVRESAQSARTKLVQKAEEEGIDLHDFATTLTCAVISPFWTVTAQVGDGVGIIELGNGELLTAAVPQRGLYANETNFLTMDDALDRLAVSCYRGQARSMALSSDGLLRLIVKLPQYAPEARFFWPLFDFLRSTPDEEVIRTVMEAFLVSERVCRRTDDDKTILLAVMTDEAKTEVPQ